MEVISAQHPDSLIFIYLFICVHLPQNTSSSPPGQSGIPLQTISKLIEMLGALGQVMLPRIKGNNILVDDNTARVKYPNT